MAGRPRWRRVALTALPLLLPWAAWAHLFSQCEDDWCGGARVETAEYVVGFTILVVGSAAILSARPLASWHVGLGSWCIGTGAASLAFAASQMIEADYMVAMVWAWLGATLIVAAMVLIRHRAQASGSAPRKSG